MDDKIAKLRNFKDAQALATNAERLGETALAQMARERGIELKAAQRAARRKVARAPSAGSKSPARTKEKADGESLFINGVFEQVLEEIESAQRPDPSLVCYLQPYKPLLIARFKDFPPSAQNPWKLYLSLTRSLALVSFEADIVYWKDKTTIAREELAELNRHFSLHQPSESGVHLATAERKEGINLLGIANLKRIDPPIVVSAFAKVSDDMPLGERTRAGGWSYVIPPARRDDFEVVAQKVWDEITEKDALRARKRSRKERLERLDNADPLPAVYNVVSKAFRRNQDVVAEVLERAAGVCEACHSPAPFVRAKDGTPYLEVHHNVMLAEGGLDTVDNALALCPNCHRRRHFGA
ncbi:HNH endonuclease [Arenimonas alkanexedens]